jgi:hypothetical protein
MRRLLLHAVKGPLSLSNPKRVLNCDLEMKGLITEGKEIKKRGRFNFKIKELMECDDEKQVLKRLGKNTVNDFYVQYGYAFTATKNTAPASMVHDVNKITTPNGLRLKKL